MEGAERSYPRVPEFACFDTAFHRTIPEVAARFALPRELFDEGVRRYEAFMVFHAGVQLSISLAGHFRGEQ